MKLGSNCVVIGAGIAGLTAAIYLKRANINVTVIESGAPGGLLNKVISIENYPGFDKISGPDLAFNIYNQATKLNIPIKYGKVLEIKDHIVKTDVDEIEASYIVIATGRSAKKLNNLENLENVSYCALCDANLYKNKEVVLIGNGSSALSEVLYLSDICKKVTMLDRSDILKGEEVLKERILKKDNIEVKYNNVINKIYSENNILKSIDTSNGLITADGVFVCVGYEPNGDFLKNIKCDNGYVLVNEKMQTNIDYIYACGDIIKKDVYQLTTAVGEATVASINIIKSLKVVK